MKNNYITRKAHNLAVLLAAVSTIAAANAAVTFDFTTNNGNLASDPDSVFTLSSLVDGSPTEAGTAADLAAVSGTLTGLVDNSASFNMALTMWDDAGATGTTVTTTTLAGTTAANSDGIAPDNGLLRGTVPHAITIAFDLSSLGVSSLTLTDIAFSPANAAASMELVVAGVSTQTVAGNAGSGVNITINDGDVLFIQNISGGTETLRLSSLTLEGVALPVPEPSAMVLSALGVLFLLRRRR